MEEGIVKKTKIIAGVIMVAAAVVLILQNREPVETQFLFVTIAMPRAVLSILMLVIGFGIGVAVSSRFSRKKR